eukprot:CAMPEP_0178439066 /NCGR_PEP_ID=MMETSP0689_2-20121128/35949_1 /TAXON_ID=160604 /ORGANISM="Amphidinium massartii, Strain CS-259" /LENGTH=376 /DNA_ID=CAMNT_0020061553 /DNA_START=53 /DNA_END=1180 /DNA_ORIENTATION=-
MAAKELGIELPSVGLYVGAHSSNGSDLESRGIHVVPLDAAYVNPAAWSLPARPATVPASPRTPRGQAEARRRSQMIEQFDAKLSPRAGTSKSGLQTPHRTRSVTRKPRIPSTARSARVVWPRGNAGLAAERRPGTGRRKTPPEYALALTNIAAHVNTEIVTIDFAVRDFNAQVDAAVLSLGALLKRLEPGRVAVEIGSRCGDLATRLARDFPQLWILPTEGTGAVSSAWLALLGESVAAFRSQYKPGPEKQSVMPPQCRLLKERHLNAGSLQSWWSSKTSMMDVVFAVNILHLLPAAEVQNMICGAADGLNDGGFLFLCGPMIAEGHGIGTFPATAELHAALQLFSRSVSRPDRPVRWCLHGLQHLEEVAEFAGLV